MKISGFTFVRNAIQFDYPVVESIQSILPLCDEVVVAVGNSADDTLGLIQRINSPKIRIIQTIWDDSLREGGKVLAQETDKAFAEVSSDSDWAFYIQADEVLHEQYLDTVYTAMQQHRDNPRVEGLLFNYTHFYGSYHYYGISRRWYRHEIRVVRNDKQIHSYGDAQGFRKNGKKLCVKPIDAHIYHYGWVRNPVAMQQKVKNFHRYWHPDDWIQQNTTSSEQYNYYNIDVLRPFEGSHPSLMQARVDNMSWNFEFDVAKQRFAWKDKLLYAIEQKTGKRLFEYKNYTKI